MSRRQIAILLLTSAVTTPPASAEPVRVMPNYQVRGEVITAPVVLKSERKAFDAAYEQFELAANEYQGEVNASIRKQVSWLQKRVSARYQGQIDALDHAQFELRLAEIARLEWFIFRHRDHETYTPDMLFRLAELYYEDTIAWYDRAQENFRREMDQFNRGKLLAPPTAVHRDFSRSVAIYKYLHWVPADTPQGPLSGKLSGVVLDKRWPNYKFSDAAMYLQGYFEYEGRQIDEAIATLSKLQAHYPTSRYIAEAWLRVGEMYFDQGKFEQAIAACKRAADRALEVRDFETYSLALKKLRWSNIQLSNFPEAVRWFKQLIEFEKAHQSDAHAGVRRGHAGLAAAAARRAGSASRPSTPADGERDACGADRGSRRCHDQAARPGRPATVTPARVAHAHRPPTRTPASDCARPLAVAPAGPGVSVYLPGGNVIRIAWAEGRVVLRVVEQRVAGCHQHVAGVRPPVHPVFANLVAHQVGIWAMGRLTLNARPPVLAVREARRPHAGHVRAWSQARVQRPSRGLGILVADVVAAVVVPGRLGQRLGEMVDRFLTQIQMHSRP